MTQRTIWVLNVKNILALNLPSSTHLRQHTMSPRVFFITGTSTGFGHELVQVVLEKGDIAVATARDPSKLKFDGMCIVFFIDDVGAGIKFTRC